MKIRFSILLILFGWCSSFAEKPALSYDDCVFVKCSVPAKGIVCSNQDRVLRLSKKLINTEEHKSSWGPFVIVGDYKGERIFIGCASVGVGSGVLFTELYANGASHIVRYGSDDIKGPSSSETYLVKIIDETDNLYGFNMQSGVPPEQWGQPVPASPQIIEALTATAKSKGIDYEIRICHHLENYHGLRSFEKFPLEKRERLKAIVEKLSENPKPASFDMESAVLFRVAKDFDAHAATILQTFNKDNGHLNPDQIKEVEEQIFFPFVLDALLQI